MSAAETNNILNRILVLHNRSLPVYLSDAVPWMSGGRDEVREVLSTIASDDRRTVDRIGAFILQNDGDVAAGEFPMQFTSLHDLSIDYCLQKVIERQRNDVQFLEQAAAALERAPMAQALAEEALGAAKGHLQSLEELVQGASA